MTGTSSRWWLRSDSEEIVIDAPADAIYDLVAELPRMGEWSPECQQVEWTNGSTGPVVDATFVGHNKGGPAGLMKWSRNGRVLEADRGRTFAFFTEEGGRGIHDLALRPRGHPRRGHPGARVLRRPLDPDLGPHRRRPDQPGQRAP